MSSAQTQILFHGATDYLGGAVLERLLEHTSAGTLEITALVRFPAKATILENNFGERTVAGTIAEHGKVSRLAENADVVFSIVTLLRDLKARKDKTGVASILIHTSGAAILNDDAKGTYSSDKVYHDSRPEEIEIIQRASLTRSVRSYIIVPPTVYGAAKGVLVDAGSGIARGQTGVVGEGEPIWNNTHADDVADLYLVLFGALLKNAEGVPHGRGGFFIAENGEHTWAELSDAIARALFKLGANKFAQPRPFAREELPADFGSEMLGYAGFGANARGRGEQARALGWNPKYSTKGLYASIKPEAQALLKEVKA
ncbi:NAD(P)-binding protein [Trametes elegans]|nr:NAD(P)-binding protein [Trametes elegans]